jgi:hypothetical protein
MSSSPPRPALAFRVGIVGHRPNRLQAADPERLRETIRDVLSIVKDTVLAFGAADTTLFSGATPILRVVSPLAEGGDRLTAEQALELGYSLCCPMPFPQDEFEKDFDPERAQEPDSLARFHALLDRARSTTGLTVFELDGQRDKTGTAYGACGRVVLRQSDVLIVLWDGENLGKSGGTEQTLAETVPAGVPAVWIHANAPHAWKIYEAGDGGPHGCDPKPGVDPRVKLREVVRAALALPELKDQMHPREVLAVFYAERKPRLNMGVLWKLFRDVFGDHKLKPLRLTVPDFESEVEQEWPRGSTNVVARLVDRLRPFFAWPDQLAIVYSNRYRSAFVLAYLLAASAVGFALSPIAMGWVGENENHEGERVFIVLEFVAILVILAVVEVWRRRRWHERWLDYRLAAELIRHLRLVVPVGGARAFPQVPAHLATYGHPAAMSWYARAVERELGLPNARLDRDHLEHCLAQLRDQIAGQRRYHDDTHRRAESIEKAMHGGGVALLGVTLLACGLHLLPGFHLPMSPLVLTFLCGFLPALGAALAGINNQGEFRRITRRSKAMADHFPTLDAEAARLQDPKRPLASGEVSTLAQQTARLMVDEVLDWRVVLLDRPPEPPA